MTSRELKDLNKFNDTMGYGSASGARRSARTNKDEEAKRDEGNVNDNEMDMFDYCRDLANEEEEDEQMMEERRGRPVGKSITKKRTGCESDVSYNSRSSKDTEDDDDDHDKDEDFVPVIVASSKKKQKSQRIDRSRIKKPKKWENPDGLSNSPVPVSLRVAFLQLDRKSSDVVYPQAGKAHKRHDYKPPGFNSASPFEELERHLKDLIGKDTDTYDVLERDFAFIYYDPTYESVSPDHDGSISDMKSRDTVLTPITDIHEFKKALISSGLVLDVGDNDDETIVSTGSADSDSVPLQLYHLDVVVTVKKAKTTSATSRSRKAIKKIKFNVLNPVIKIKEEKESKKSKNDNTNSSNSSDDDDEDADEDDDDEVYTYEIDGGKQSMGSFELDYTDVGDHFYDPVRAGAVAIYNKKENKKMKKRIGMKSPICVLNDGRKKVCIVLRSTDELIVYIDKCKLKQKRVKKGILEIDISLGEKLQDDEYAPPLHFLSSQTSTGTVGTKSINSPQERTKSKASDTKKAALFNEQLKVDIKTIFTAYYKYSPEYKKKLCSEHYDVLLRRYRNSHTEVKKMMKEVQQNQFGTLNWMNGYQSLTRANVPPFSDNVEYNWDCVNDMPSGRQEVTTPQQQGLLIQQQMVSTVQSLVQSKTDTNKATAIRIFRKVLVNNNSNNNGNGSSGNGSGDNDDAVVIEQEISVILSTTDLDKCTTGNDVLKEAHAESQKLPSSSALFHFDQSDLDSLKSKDKVIIYRFRDLDPPSEKFKVMTIKEILKGRNETVNIEMELINVHKESTLVDGGGFMF